MGWPKILVRNYHSMLYKIPRAQILNCCLALYTMRPTCFKVTNDGLFLDCAVAGLNADNLWACCTLFAIVTLCWLLYQNLLHLSYQMCLNIVYTYFLTNWINKSMEQSPSCEASKFSASQEILHILWNPGVHHHIHKSPPPVPILHQMKPVLVPFPMSWRYILILSFPLFIGLPNGLSPSCFPTITQCVPPLFPVYATCPSHLILLDLITQRVIGEEYRLNLLIM